MTTPFHLMWFTTYSSRNWDIADNQHYHWLGPALYRDMARVIEERGALDAIVFADSDGIPTSFAGSSDHAVKWGLENVGKGDPLPMLAAMSSATKQIGLVATLSTSFFTPQLLAHAVGTMDHLSSGRAGWNIVTSLGSHNAQNYGFDDLPDGNARYDRADAFVQDAEQLWSTAGQNAATLAMPRLPQGKPVYMQAGGSERGREFAARYAEIVIVHSRSVPAMKKYRADMRARMERIGRDPNGCKIFFTAKPVIAATRAEAEALYEKTKNRPALSMESGLVNWASRIGFDLSALPLDEPISADMPIWGSVGQLQQYFDRAKVPTLREVAREEAIKESYLALGSAKEVADQMARDMEEIGGDGFAIRETMHPANVIPVVDLLVPELRRMGLVRSRYRHSTFRENLLDPAFNDQLPS
jgi:alkanesulfonate monooxygenase SsuD/methylene tetrahydromethanopterin reductase-like flavin-dependent oxidoreductase (luciferase family)